MGSSEAPISADHLYPLSLQLKLYQSFMFSIPILFFIILFLFFYLFYLKRMVFSTQHTPPPTLQEPPFTSSIELGFKGNLKDKLSVFVLDEESRTTDSMCCVCLGEFEKREELHRIPSCKHVFHADCINHWLCSNPTCPLCRCFIVTTTTTTTTTTATTTTHAPIDVGINMVVAMIR